MISMTYMLGSSLQTQWPVVVTQWLSTRLLTLRSWVQTQRLHDIHHNDTQHNDAEHNDTEHIDTQHNNTQHNDVKQNKLNCDTQHNNTRHKQQVSLL
jgi:hypothetical protein